VSWFSLVIGQNANRQLATSSENLVASTQFLVALATSESQCRALFGVGETTEILIDDFSHQEDSRLKIMNNRVVKSPISV